MKQCAAPWVAAPAGGVMMRVTPEDILTGGLGLCRGALCDRRRARMDHVDAPARFLALYGAHASRPRHGGSVGQVSLRRAG